MSMNPIQSSSIPARAVLAVQSNSMGIKKGTNGSPVHQVLMQSLVPNLGVGVLNNLKHLQNLKQKLMSTHKGNGQMGTPKARRQHLQSHMNQVGQNITSRLGRMMNRYRSHGTGVPLGNTPSGTAQSGSDYSFLDDPKMSMSDKIELFLQKIMKDSEEKMEKLMREYDTTGTSAQKTATETTGTSKAKGKGKGRRWAKAGALLLKIGTAVAAVVASVYATPAAGAAIAAGGAALSKKVDQAVDKKFGGTTIGDTTTASTTGTTGNTAEDKVKNESDRRMIFFKIQKLQTAVQEMVTFFSTKLKKEADLNNTLIRNMA